MHLIPHAQREVTLHCFIHKVGMRTDGDLRHDISLPILSIEEESRPLVNQRNIQSSENVLLNPHVRAILGPCHRNQLDDDDVHPTCFSLNRHRRNQCLFVSLVRLIGLNQAERKRFRQTQNVFVRRA